MNNNETSDTIRAFISKSITQPHDINLITVINVEKKYFGSEVFSDLGWDIGPDFGFNLGPDLGSKIQ